MPLDPNMRLPICVDEFTESETELLRSRSGRGSMCGFVLRLKLRLFRIVAAVVLVHLGKGTAGGDEGDDRSEGGGHAGQKSFRAAQVVEDGDKDVEGE